MNTGVFTYGLRYSKVTKEYVAFCSEYPNLISKDPNPKQAMAGIRRLVHETMQSVKETSVPSSA